MEYININTLSELEMGFVRRLRFSKSLDTLDRQTELMEISNAGDKKALEAINTAWCVRELELKRVGAPVFKHGKMRIHA